MKQIIILLICGFLLFGCNASSKENPKESNEQISKNENQQDNHGNTIELNNGKKWKVDENMLIHIRNMETDINLFIENDLKDYNYLSEKLKSNIDLLTSNCTMKGKAHDELHKWLIPFINSTTTLSNSNSNEEAYEHLKDIQLSFKVFNQFFE